MRPRSKSGLQPYKMLPWVVLALIFIAHQSILLSPKPRVWEACSVKRHGIDVTVGKQVNETNNQIVDMVLVAVSVPDYIASAKLSN